MTAEATTQPDDDSTAGALEFLDDLSSGLRVLFETVDPEDRAVRNAIRLIVGFIETERDRVLDGRCPSCGSRHDDDGGGEAVH